MPEPKKGFYYYSGVEEDTENEKVLRQKNNRMIVKTVIVLCIIILALLAALSWGDQALGITGLGHPPAGADFENLSTDIDSSHDPLQAYYPEETQEIPPGMPEINADRKYIPIILSILNHTDKNVVKYIRSITVMDDMNKLRTICTIDAFGCAIGTIGNNVFSGSSIYVASKNNYDPRCRAFEILLHHEIGHVVYLYQYGPAGYSRDDDETFAINYARKYVDPIDVDKCMQKINGNLENYYQEIWKGGIFNHTSGKV